MPLDGTLYQETRYTEAARQRWSVSDDKPVPRSITPMSDTQALYAIWRYLETRWSSDRLHDGDNHCVVGWVVQLCEPTTVIDWKRPQTARLLKHLHAALPAKDQRKKSDHHNVLARFNDTHRLQDVRDLVQRAYLTAVNAEIDRLNG